MIPNRINLRTAVNGVFSVYKPRGWTSRKAVDYVQDKISNEILRRVYPDRADKLTGRNKIKIGHGGTLDPLAEGVLVMGVGEGCKGLRGYLQCEKEYLVTAKFGAATDTYDSQGVITHQGKTDHMTRELVENTMPMFRGCITQVPPIYSALRMNGKRLYDYARQGIALPKAIEGRQTTIDELEMVEYNVDECVFRVKCGGGTYMRSLVNDMAISMGTYGHMTALIRTRQGLFNVDNSLTLDEDLSLSHVLKKIIEMNELE